MALHPSEIRPGEQTSEEIGQNFLPNENNLF